MIEKVQSFCLEPVTVELGCLVFGGGVGKLHCIGVKPTISIMSVTPSDFIVTKYKFYPEHLDELLPQQ